MSWNKKINNTWWCIVRFMFLSNISKINQEKTRKMAENTLGHGRVFKTKRKRMKFEDCACSHCAILSQNWRSILKIKDCQRNFSTVYFCIFLMCLHLRKIPEWCHAVQCCFSLWFIIIILQQYFRKWWKKLKTAQSFHPLCYNYSEIINIHSSETVTNVFLWRTLTNWLT